MPDSMWSVLSEPLIRCRWATELRECTLPEVLAALSAGEDVEFSSVQRHQTQAWHSFLAQLGAIALQHGEVEEPPADTAAWKALLLSLTDQQEDPWSLIGEDLSRPALLQPPVPEGTLDAWPGDTTTPDGIDVLIVAKNHDVKAERIRHARAEHWLFALVTLQTMEGYFGRGNFGIARMNGGFASRPMVTVTAATSGARFRRDVEVWIESRPGLAAGSHGYADANGLALLWLEPWDGLSSLSLARLDPIFIEICRRVRLVVRDGRVTARTAPTQCARTATRDRELKGNTGDVWTPIKEDGAALTVSADGFSYTLVQDLLFGGNFHRPPALTIRAVDGAEPVVLAQVMVRGQGRTEGLHERQIPVRKKAANLLRSAAGTSQLGELARERVETVANIRKKVLRPPILVALQGAPAKLDMQDDRAAVWTTRLDDRVDEVFFEQLWADIDREAAERAVAWQRLVLGFARHILADAIDALPVPTVRHYRVVAEAEGLFHGLARKHFPEATRTEKEDASGDIGQTTD